MQTNSENTRQAEAARIAENLLLELKALKDLDQPADLADRRDGTLEPRRLLIIEVLKDAKKLAAMTAGVAR